MTEMRIKIPGGKKLLIVAIPLAIVALSLAIGFLTYPEERALTGAPSFPGVEPEPGPVIRPGGEPTPGPLPAPTATPAPSGVEAYTPYSAELTPLEFLGRMIIYAAQVSLEVEDVDAAANKIQSVAEGVGGFVQTLSISGGERKSGFITVRVPQEKFYDVLRQVESVGNVTNKEVSGQDVTEQYIDLEARLKNAESEEERLLAILDKATEVSDILMVEKELMRVRETIEGLKGQLQYLERRVAYSVISVYLEQAARAPVISDVRAEEVTTTRATIKWTTDVPSTSLVEYGTTTEYGSQVYDLRPVNEHTMTITGLKDSTTYHYRVKSTAYGKTATSADRTFTTESEPWVKLPDIDWGYAIERGLWGFLFLVQALITVLMFLGPFAIVVGVPVYYFYRRRRRTEEA